MTNIGWKIGLAAALLLTACTEREVILPGPREDLRAGEVATFSNREAPVKLGRQTANSAWPQSFGTKAFRVDNAALNAKPTLMWSAKIGAGDTRKGRITAEPVVADGRVYTLDADAQVLAHGINGAPLWSKDLRPDRDGAGQASGGGLAYSDGRIYATSGYGILSALDAATGDVIWQQKLGQTASGMPVVSGGMVYLVSGDDTAWAIDKVDGRVRWQLAATPTVSNVLGGPAPALTSEFAIFAYGDGDLQAAFRKGGLRIWDSAITGRRRFWAASQITDITGDPVVDGNRLYVGTYAGRTVALNPGNGERIWTAAEGAVDAVWPAGNAIFMVNDDNELVRLNAADGSRVWAVDLPRFTKSRPRRQAEIYSHLGPIVAGNQVIVASSDGPLRFFNPVSGEMTYEVEVPGGATTAPVVAGGTLYVVGSKGQLHAFR